MPQFIFRLQTLLDQKIEAERLAIGSLHEKQLTLERETALLSELAEKEKQIERRILQAQEELIVARIANSASDVHWRNNRLDELKQDLSSAHDDTVLQKFAVEEAEMSVKAAENHLLECSREVEKLKKYRGRQEDRFMTEAARKEDLAQDELGTVMYLSRRADA